MIFFPSSIDLFVVPSHLYIKKGTSPVQRYPCETLLTLSLAREIHKLTKKKEHTLVTTFLENSTLPIPRPQKGRERKIRLLIRNHHSPLRQNLMRIRQIRQFFLFGFRPIIHRRSVIDCRSMTILTILTMMMTIDTIQ